MELERLCLSVICFEFAFGTNASAITYMFLPISELYFIKSRQDPDLKRNLHEMTLVAEIVP